VVRAVEPEDVATLIYTLGTTGPPKGVELTHASLIALWNMLVRVWPIRPGGRVISYLPPAHIGGRNIGLYLTNTLGYTVTCCPDPAQLGAGLAECRPTFFFGVPRVWEKLKASIEAHLAAGPPEVRAAFDDAFAASLERARAQQAGSAFDPQATRRALLKDERVFASIRARLGLDQAEVLIVGAAPTPMQVHEFFAAIGLMLSEVWGMSELSGVGTWNPPGRIKLGSCGPPLPGVDVRLGADGEVLVAGPIVMRGYRNRPDKTAEVIDEQGLPALRRHRPARPGRLPHDRGPQERADHQQRRQEHVTGQYRGPAQDLQSTDRPSGLYRGCPTV
jgi:long-subunit acyl-CoA synthetase (AMP-forming)